MGKLAETTVWTGGTLRASPLSDFWKERRRQGSPFIAIWATRSSRSDITRIYVIHA